MYYFIVANTILTAKISEWPTATLVDIPYILLAAKNFMDTGVVPTTDDGFVNSACFTGLLAGINFL
jgi:hypothetical protein